MNVIENLPDLIDEKKTSAMEIGRLFFEERTRRQLSIATISKELHIRQLYLSCIESGDLDKLPGYVYVIGFIKSYANFLNLDANEIFRRLLLEKEDSLSTHPLQQASIPIHQQQQPSLKLLFASLTLLIVFGFSIYIMNNMTTNQLNIGSILPIQDPAGTLSRNASTTNVAPQSEPAADHPVEQEFQIEQTTEAPSSLAASDATPIVPSEPNQNLSVKVSPSKPLSLTEEAVTPVTTDNTSASVSQKTENPVAEDAIQIVTTKDAWVQILNSKGKNIFVRLMHAGETYTIPASENDNHYTLNTGNGGGVKIVWNGQESPTLGEEGKVIRGISLAPHDLKTTFFAPTTPAPTT